MGDQKKYLVDNQFMISQSIIFLFYASILQFYWQSTNNKYVDFFLQIFILISQKIRTVHFFTLWSYTNILFLNQSFVLVFAKKTLRQYLLDVRQFFITFRTIDPFSCHHVIAFMQERRRDYFFGERRRECDVKVNRL